MAVDRHIPVSVIVCAYRSRDRILPTLRSILDQDFTDFELLVIDDASGDDTPSFLGSLDDPRVRVLENPENLGVAGSRNRGVEEARGELIAHCDHDDLWEPGKLSAQVDFLRRHEDCGVLGTGLRKLLKGSPMREPSLVPTAATAAEMHWSLLFSPPFPHSSVVYRKHLLRELDVRYDPTLDFADDWDVFLRLARGTQVLMLDEPYVTYHLHGENWSRRERERMGACGVRILARELSHWLGEPVAETVAAEFFAAMIVGSGCESVEDLRRTGRLTARLFDLFMDAHEVDEQERSRAESLTGLRWWRAVRGSSRHGGAAALAVFREAGMPAWWKPPLSERSRARVATTWRGLGLGR